MGATGVSGATEAEGEWSARGVLVLGYGVWVAGVAAAGQLSEFAMESGVLSGKWVAPLLWLIVYPALIQLPLAVFYDRSWGTSSPSARRPRFLRPTPVYGAFGAIAAGLVLSLVIADVVVDGSWGIDGAVLWALWILLEAALLYAYFPVIVLGALLARWARPVLRRFGVLSGEGTTTTTPPPDGPAGDAGDTTARRDDAGDGVSAPEGAGDATAGPEDTGDVTAGPDDTVDGAGAQEAGPLPTGSGTVVQFVTVAGLVAVPVGLGFAARSPQAGIGIASLLLTSYQIVS